MATGTNRIEEIFGDARSQADALEMLAQERSRNAAKEAQGDEAVHRVLLCWPGPTRSRSGLLRLGAPSFTLPRWSSPRRRPVSASWSAGPPPAWRPPGPWRRAGSVPRPLRRSPVWGIPCSYLPIITSSPGTTTVGQLTKLFGESGRDTPKVRGPWGPW